MDYLNVDTDKIVSVGIELKEISKDLTLITNELYSKLMNVSNNGIWTNSSDDGSANVFIQAVAKDNEVMKKYELSLNQLGEQISLYGKHLANTSNNNQI